MCPFYEEYVKGDNYFGNGLETKYFQYLNNHKKIKKIESSFFESKQFTENFDLFEKFRKEKPFSIILLNDLKNFFEWCCNNPKISNDNQECKNNFHEAMYILESMIEEENIKIHNQIISVK